VNARRLVENSGERPGTAAHRWHKALDRVFPVCLVIFMTLQGAVLWLQVLNVQIDRFENLAGPGIDYVAYYAAGRLVLEGRGGELYDLGAIAAQEREALNLQIQSSDVQPYFNPPFLAAVFALPALGPAHVFAIGTCVQVVVLMIAGGVCLQRFLNLRRNAHRLAFWAWYPTSFAFITMAIDGQISMLLFLAWLGFVWFQVEGKEGRSGLALGLALVKPQSVIFIVLVLLAKRQWGALRSFGLMAASLGTASMVISGPGMILDYPLFLMDSVTWNGFGIMTERMLGWNGFLASLVGQAPPLLLVAPFWLLTAAVIAWCWRGPYKPKSNRFLLQAAVTIAGSLLCSPHLYLQDIALVVLLIGFGLRFSLVSGSTTHIWLKIAVAAWFLQAYATLPLTGLGVNLITPAIALLGIYLLLTIRQDRAGREDATGSTATQPLMSAA
jgi:hypothetical protein